MIKLNYLNEYHGGDFASAKARFAAILYHDISKRGIYNQLLRVGVVRAFGKNNEIISSLEHPPLTRAEFRSRYLQMLLCHNKGVSMPMNIGWGTFSGPYTFFMRDPRTRTSEEAEEFLKRLEMMLIEPARNSEQ